MANRYWVGGAGTWGGSDTAHWSSSSGGASGASSPGLTDNVFFDANSGTGSISFDFSPLCADLNTTGALVTFPNTDTGSGVTVRGNIVLGKDFGRSIAWVALGSASITSNGYAVYGLSIGDNISATVSSTFTLNDDLRILSSTTYYPGTLSIHSQGTATTIFNANNKNIICGNVYIFKSQSGVTTVNMGSGTWTITNYIDFGVTTHNVWQVLSGVTLNANTSTIKFTSSNQSGIIFVGGGYTYNNVWFNRNGSSGYIQIKGSNTFNDFKDSSDSTHALYFTAGTTQTVNTFSVAGTSPTNQIIISSDTTGTHTLTKSGGGTIVCDYIQVSHSIATPSNTWYAGSHSTNSQSTTTAGSGWIFTTWPVPTLTTQAVSPIGDSSSTGNATITGGSALENADKRGFVWGLTSLSDPGNVAPGSSSYTSSIESTGNFSTGTFTNSITGLGFHSTFYVRGYAHNSAGYAYGNEVSFSSLNFTNPTYAYADDANYATTPAITNTLTVKLSKDNGVNFNSPITSGIFTGTESTLTLGSTTELWGTSWIGSNLNNANLKLRIYDSSAVSTSQDYGGFGFSISPASATLTGLQVQIKAKIVAGVWNINRIQLKAYYGTSVIPVVPGSQAYASNGRKNGEAAGQGKGIMVYYDSNGKWVSFETGQEVAE